MLREHYKQDKNHLPFENVTLAARRWHRKSTFLIPTATASRIIFAGFQWRKFIVCLINSPNSFAPNLVQRFVSRLN